MATPTNDATRVDGSVPHASAADGAIWRLARWALVLRGGLGILFGIAALLVPGVTFVVLVIMLAAYLIADGVLALVAGVRAGREGRSWLPYILEGLANLAVGAVCLAMPGATGLALVYLVAIWAIFTGVLLLMPSPAHGGISRIMVILGGLVSIALGILMIAWPIDAGMLAVVWMAGSYALLFGIAMLVAGLRLDALRAAGVAANASIG
jgi:uncharacterized membrane protein HdeD (DUF308 family)